MSSGPRDKVFRVAVKGASPEVTQGNGKDVLPRHWFYAGITSSGEIIKKDSDSCAGFREICEHSSLTWIDYWAGDFDKNGPAAASQLGFSDLLISQLIGEYATNYQDFDTEMGMRLPAVHVDGFEVKSYPLLILLKKNFILTIHPLSLDRRFSLLHRYSDTILKKIPAHIPAENKVTILLMRLIDENNDRNFEELQKIEQRGDSLSEGLVDPGTPRDKLGAEIYEMKHALIAYLNALWQSVDVLRTVRYGDAQIISADQRLLDRLDHLAEDVNRQIGLAEHLSDVLASGLEVLQSIYNNQLQGLNNRLALAITYLTIIGTAVLVPNTLATIFSNPAFQMGPEDKGWYVTLLVVSTVIATGVAYWWAKKLGWLPRRPD